MERRPPTFEDFNRNRKKLDEDLRSLEGLKKGKTGKELKRIEDLIRRKILESSGSGT